MWGQVARRCYEMRLFRTLLQLTVFTNSLQQETTVVGNNRPGCCPQSVQECHYETASVNVCNVIRQEVAKHDSVLYTHLLLPPEAFYGLARGCRIFTSCIKEHFIILWQTCNFFRTKPVCSILVGFSHQLVGDWHDKPPTNDTQETCILFHLMPLMRPSHVTWLRQFRFSSQPWSLVRITASFHRASWISPVANINIYIWRNMICSRNAARRSSPLNSIIS